MLLSTVSHLGESDQQAAAAGGAIVVASPRPTDPFGNTIRGPYKGLPPVVEHPTPAPDNRALAAAPAANVPTLEKAVQELSIGAVNVGAHEILIGSRSVREGDLLVLESGGSQFVVWVQSVGVRGVHVLRHRYAKASSETVWIRAKRITRQDSDPGNRRMIQSLFEQGCTTIGRWDARIRLTQNAII